MKSDMKLKFLSKYDVKMYFVTKKVIEPISWFHVDSCLLLMHFDKMFNGT